jgi:GNAT superfamily N-acetyltransferase
MFAEFAAHVGLSEELHIGERQLHDALFAAPPAAEALLAERAGEVVGYALFFQTFASFAGTKAIWLEDLYVRPRARGCGAGRALLAALARLALERAATRLDWVVLDRNAAALAFYERLGAERKSEWVNHSLGGAAAFQSSTVQSRRVAARSSASRASAASSPRPAPHPRAPGRT